LLSQPPYCFEVPSTAREPPPKLGAGIQLQTRYEALELRV